MGLYKIEQINGIKLNKSRHGRDKDGAGESKLQTVPPCWALTQEHCSNLDTGGGISCCKE